MGFVWALEVPVGLPLIFGWHAAGIWCLLADLRLGVLSGLAGWVRNVKGRELSS